MTTRVKPIKRIEFTIKPLGDKVDHLGNYHAVLKVEFCDKTYGAVTLPLPTDTEPQDIAHASIKQFKVCLDAGDSMFTEEVDEDEAEATE